MRKLIIVAAAAAGILLAGCQTMEEASVRTSRRGRTT